MTKPIIIFDGVCVLCSRLIRLVLFADQNKQRLRFATSQSDVGQENLKNNNLSITDFDTILFVTQAGETHMKMDAVIEIGKTLGGIWLVLRVFKLLPKKQRNALYDFIATRRYKWFGKSEYCERIPPEYLERIIQ